MNKLRNIACVGIALAMSAMSTAYAGTLGSLGLTDAVGVTVGAGTLDDIGAATIFNFADLQTTAIATGIYAGVPITDIGPVTFDSTLADGLFIQLGSTTFQSETAVRQQPNATNVIFTYTGLLTNGGTTPNPIEAILNFNFSQVGGPGTAITGSGTLVVPSTVPEPSTILLGSLGALSFLPFARRQKRLA
jgi:hypothetical protein